MQILFWKKRAEEELQRSGLDYTIIRPGELLCSCRSCMLVGGCFFVAAPWHAQTYTRPAWSALALTAAAAHAKRSRHMQSRWMLRVASAAQCQSTGGAES